MYKRREIDHGETDDVSAAIDAAVLSGGLVLVERPHEIYWDGLPIDVDWITRNVLFLYMSTLVRQAKANRQIDLTSFGERTYPGSLKNWKHRLRKEPRFPSSLVDLIRPVNCGQRLDVPSEKIHIFESALD